MFLPHFDVFCDLLLNRRTATWNLFVLYNNEEKSLFISKSFNISSKAGLCGAYAHCGEHEKKPFDVVYCLYKMKQSHWFLCVAKNRDWSRKSRHCHTWLERRFSWNENLQRKQNWTAKSTNLKKILDRSSQFLTSEQPCKPKSLDVAWEIAAGVELIRSENLRLRSTWRPFDSSFEWEERYWRWKFVYSVVGDSQISLK